MSNYEHYTYRVTWSVDDEEFVGLCTEFPSLSYLDEERSRAMDGIIQLVNDVVDDMRVNGEEIPDPLAEKQYSGKLVLRMPPEQHRELAIRAAEAGVSLNRYLNARLASV